MDELNYFRFAELKELLQFKFPCSLHSIGTCERDFFVQGCVFFVSSFSSEFENTKRKTVYVQEGNSLQNYSCRQVYGIHFFHSDFIFIDIHSSYQCSQAYVHITWLTSCQAGLPRQAVTRRNFFKSPSAWNSLSTLQIPKPGRHFLSSGLEICTEGCGSEAKQPAGQARAPSTPQLEEWKLHRNLSWEVKC